MWVPAGSGGHNANSLKLIMLILFNRRHTNKEQCHGQDFIKLGAIVVIRTGLNYFLMREMKEEQVKNAGQSQIPQE